MCDHKKIEYIGDQEFSNGESHALYNCLNCHTTITLSSKSALHKQSKNPVLHWSELRAKLPKDFPADKN